MNPELEKGGDSASLITTTIIHEVALILPFFGIVILNAGMSTRAVKRTISKKKEADGLASRLVSRLDHQKFL